MCRALKVQDVEAEILTTDDAGPEVLPVITNRFIEHEGVNVCFLPRWSPRLGALREFQYSPELSPWLHKHLREYDGLHVHAIFSHFPTRTMQLARQMGVPYLARPLGQLDPWSLAQSAWKKRLYWRFIERNNLHNAQAIHCTSAIESANVSRLLPGSRIEVIPHGVEPSVQDPHACEKLQAQLGIPQNHRILLFLARWHPKKNLPLLLQALGQLRSKDWTLVLAGQGTESYSHEIHSVIASNGLQQRVRIPGHVTGALKSQLLQGSDLFILPSESENFGIAVAEALVSGLRCVVTKGVDIAPAVQALDGGTVCEPTLSSLASSLDVELQRTFHTKSELSERASARFSWVASASRLKTLYSELLIRRSDFKNLSHVSP